MSAVMTDGNRRRPTYSVEELTNDLQQLDTKLSKNIDHHVDFTKDLLDVSMKDRNAMTEEIHGVSTMAVPESPEFLEQALFELSRELSAIPEDDPLKANYLESQILPETYVNTPDFRLRFLRCELFDAKKAAIRMLNFLDLSTQLYGPQLLQRPPQLQDLTKEEMDVLRDGAYQILPFRDRAGRPIFTWIGKFRGTDTSTKLGLYLHWVMSNDVESQRKGAIKIMWRAGAATQKKEATNFMHRVRWDRAKHNQQYYGGIPLRTTTMHWCLPNDRNHRAFRLALSLVMRKFISQARMRFHHGGEMELRYNLKTYGIPVELIAIDEDGDIKTKYWKQWIQVRNKLEQGQNKDQSMILFPGSNDVLFKMGDSLTSHIGNSLLQGYIEDIIQEHSAASQNEKKAITTSIITKIEGKGGKFLEYNKKGWWMELGDSSVVYKKVANQVKLFKRKMPLAAKPLNVRSSTDVFKNQDNSVSKRRKFSVSLGDFDVGFDSDNSSECFCVF